MKKLRLRPQIKKNIDLTQEDCKMSNEISTINNNFPSQMELQNIGLIARTAHASGLYGGVGGEAKIMMILLSAKELGVGPCQALNGGIWSIQGKIEISPRLMNGLIRRAGHSIKIVRSTDTECTLRGTRTDGDSFECTFTMQDAVKAGLAGGNVWKKYPEDMLYNRCMSRLGRRLFSDVIGQCYIEGEISEAKSVEKLETTEYEDVTSKQEVRGIPQPQPDSCPIPQKPPVEKISLDQLTDIETIFQQTDKEFQDNFMANMKQYWDAEKLFDLPANYYKSACDKINTYIKSKEMK